MQKTILLVLSIIVVALNASAGLPDTAQALDETIRNVDLHQIVPAVAEKLGIDAQIVTAALITNSNKLSNLALAKFLSDKTGDSVESVLQKQIPDWESFFGKNSSIAREADEHLDMLQTEFALMMLDYREGRKK